MDSARVGIMTAAVVIVILAFATGPVGLLEVPGPSYDALGTGVASVDVQSAPDTVTLRGDDYGDVYYLEVPATTLAVGNVTGSPTLTVSISVQELGYSRSTLYVLDETWSGQRTVTVERAPLNATRIDSNSYDGSLRLVLRDGSGTTVLHQGNVTVEVAE